MANNAGSPSSNEIPFGQRLADSPYILLALGLITMFAFYTIWGMIEIILPPQVLGLNIKLNLFKDV